MNKLSKKTSKREILKYMVIIMLFNIAIIMCLGINNKDNKVISKNNSKNIIHKEVVDGVEIEILADSGVFPKDASATIKKLEKQAETDKVKDAISKRAESSSKSIDSVYSYDITVKDSKGKELQPDTSKGEVIVVFKDIQGLDKNNIKSVKVWHVKDDLDEAEEVNSGVEVCENRVDIKVQHFSIYSVVINEEQDKTIKYFEGASDDTSYFMIEDAEDLCIFRDIVNGVISDTNPIQVEYENEDANNKKEDIHDISKLVKNARLVNNIYMSEIDIDNWKPIGTETKEFKGIFDNTNFEYNSDVTEGVDNPTEYSISGIDKDRLFNNYDQAKIHVNVEGDYLCVPVGNSELTKFLKGAGTVESPYLIKTAEDFEYMAHTIRDGIRDGINGETETEIEDEGIINGSKSSVKAISACYELVNNISLEGNWQPICPVRYVEGQPYNTPDENEIGFKGIIDGKENWIEYKSTVGGLFGKVSENGIIRNLNVEGTLTKNLPGKNNDYKADLDNSMVCLGTLVGINYGNIVNCNIGGSITTKNDKIYENLTRIGGVVGDNSGVMSDVKCAVKIDVKNMKFVMLGGMVGVNEEYARVEGCSYTNEDNYSIILDDLNGYAGGIVGYNKGEINKVLCKTNTKIIANDTWLDYGGICGVNAGESSDYPVINNAMVNSEITLATSEGCTVENNIGGIVGCAQYDGCIGNSYANVKINIDSDSTEKGLENLVYIGGAVGAKEGSRNQHKINYCYSIMDIGNNISNVNNTCGIYYSKYQGFANKTDYYFNIKVKGKPDEKNIPENFVNELNKNSKPNNYCQWIKDTNNDNDSYPILDFTKEEVSYEEDASKINIYGNGCGIIIKYQSGETVFYQDKNKDGEIDAETDNKIDFGEVPLADKTINVFGGSKDKLDSDTRITMLGGTVTNIYGGGCGKSSEVNNTVIDITCGNVTNVYGGSYKGLVKGSSTINISDGNITNIYGGSYNGLVIDSSTINISDGNITNIYGGSYKGLVKGSSTINISDGTITDVYGAGEYITDGDSGQVLCGTTIKITGGKISGKIDANGVAKGSSDNAKTIGHKIINISGNPEFDENLDGINISSFTNKVAKIDDILSVSSTKQINIDVEPSIGMKVAELDSFSYANVNQFRFTGSMPEKGVLFKYIKNESKADIVIAEQLDSELSSESTNVISNDTINELGYGFGPYVAKGYEWKGTIKANPGYTLPPTIEVKIGEYDAVQGKDYKYDKYTGEVTVFKGKTKDNIKVTAKAIYVPPIIAVDKPFVSTTDFSYTGTPQSPILIDTDKYTVSVTRETNVGEYTMVVSLKDKVYTRWNDGTNDDLYIKWRINKVDLKVIAKDKSITYGDSPTNAGVSYEGFVNGENQSVLKGDLSYDYNYARYDNVGNYVITPKGYEADNYNITYTSGTLKVFPKKLSFKWSSPSEFKYDGKVKVMTASIVGIVNNDDVRIASYAHNKTDKVGTYVAKVTGITGTKKDNYTLEGATNISKKWSIVKDKDKEEDKDKNENKDNIKDNGDKNDTSGANNDKGNVNNNKNNNNNSSNNTSSNKGNSNNTNKNQSNGNYDKVNMYDKLANNNDYKTDIDGAIEGVKTSDNEIQVELNNGMIISAMGDFEESIRLMVKEIKSKRKEWDWVNSLTKDIGINKGIYDIFFVNSKGVKVNTGRGTKISIMSRERLKKVNVYYINKSSERIKIKSNKEEYIVKFKMVENGYYTLILNDKNNLIEGKDDDVNVVDKYSTTDNNDKNSNKDADTINDKDNQDDIEDKTNVNANKDGDSGSEINTSQDSTNHNIKNTDKQQKEKEDGINWLLIISIILVIIVMMIVSVFILKRFSKDKEE